MTVAFVLSGVHGAPIWTVVEDTDIQKTYDEIAYANRWFTADSKSYVQARGMTLPVTNPYDRWWAMSITREYSGWNCVPVHQPIGPEGIDSDREGSCTGFIKAPSAALAVERIRFMRLERGKKSD